MASIIKKYDRPEIKEVFKHLPVKEMDYKYTVGGNNKSSYCVELIYGTWSEGKVPDPHGQAKLF